MQHLERAADHQVPEGRPNHYVEHLRVPSMSVGTYCIPAGGVDDQKPHPADEVYVVLSGRGTLEAAGRRVPVSAGSTLYVPAGEEHRFVEVAENLTVLVVFAPPYTASA